MSRTLMVGTVLMTGALLVAAQPAEAQGRGRGRVRVHAPVHVRVSPQVRVQVGGWYGHRPAYAYYPWGWGWGGWPGYFPPYPYPYYYGYGAANVRVQVEPKSAEVYIDGHLAGMVDDFDGFFQRLQVEPGGREITIYKEGFRSYTERVYLRSGQSYGIRYTMQPLDPGEPDEPRPVGAVRVEGRGGVGRPLPPMPGREREPEEYEPTPVPEPRATEAVPGNFGQLAIRVQPEDAEILIDDEPWRAPQGAERLVVHLKPGTHRVEVRKEGFDPFVTSIEIKKNETAVINVSLGRLSGV